MNLTEYAVLNGIKLSKAEGNLLVKLDNMFVNVNADEVPAVVVNPTNGFSAEVTPFIATLIRWVYKVYGTYDFTGAMNYRGHHVAINTFDRVRYLILKLDPKAFSNFID